MLGSSLEAGGDLAGALKEAYRPVESGGAGSGAAADCLLHAVFDNLELQNSAEAVRLVGVLGQAPDDVVAAATAPGQIRAFVQLIGAGGEGECWTAARQWWPAWETFAREVGIPAPGVPEIPDIDGLARQAEIAIATGAGRDFFGTTCFWPVRPGGLPSVAVQVGSLEADVGDFVPERRAEIRSLSIALLEAPIRRGFPGAGSASCSWPRIISMRTGRMTPCASRPNSSANPRRGTGSRGRCTSFAPWRR